MRVIEGRRADGEHTSLTLILDAIAGRKICARGVGWARHRAHHEIGVGRVAGEKRGALELGLVRAGRARHGRIGLTPHLRRAELHVGAVDAVGAIERRRGRGAHHAVVASVRRAVAGRQIRARRVDRAALGCVIGVA